MIPDPTFKPGDKVVPFALAHYRNVFTEGRVYEVVRYEPELRDTTYTWPAYVWIINDLGELCCTHAYRFKALSV